MTARQPKSPPGAVSHSIGGKPGKVVEVAAGLVFRDGKLLITQRRMADHLGGFWEFPGGKREESETFEQCLTRELREELGIEIDILELAETVYHRYPQKKVELHFYRCRWREHEPRPFGCEAIRWIHCDELALFAFPPADARLLVRLASTPQWWESSFPKT